MASTKQPFIRNLFRGVNQLVGRHQLEEGECYNLLNFRPSNGKLQVTPPLIIWFALSTLTGESGASQIKLLKLVRNLNGLLRYLIINHKTARFVDPTSTATQTQIPIVLQTKKANNTTVYGECLLYGFNVTDFAATSDYIEVEIQTATTFRWNRNGGAWNSDNVIASEVALGINGLKVSFQETDGYTAGNLWRWTRSWNHPYTGADAGTANFPFSTAVYNKDIYVGGLERNIMRVRDDFLTSVGYTRAYGKHVCVFQNHLFVSQYAAGVYDGALGVADGYVAATTPFTVGWSHRENPDQFFFTDVNEADEYSFPQQAAQDWSNLGITGMGELNDNLFVYLPDSVKVGVYTGLPTVMRFRTVHPGIGNLFPAGLVIGNNGHYFISRSDVYCFDGLQFKSIGAKVIDKFKAEIVAVTDSKNSETIGYYDADKAEVVFSYWTAVTGGYQMKQMIYQEQTGEWYFRNVPSQYTGYDNLYCQEHYTGTWGLSIFGGRDYVYKDWSSGSAGTYCLDTTVAGVQKYTVPTIETRVADYNHKHAVKEIDSIYLDYYANYVTSVLGLSVDVVIGESIAKLGSYSVMGTYDPESTAHVGKWLTFKKQNGRIFGYRFRIGDGTAVVRDGIVYGYEEEVYGIPNQTEK
jgi:hypothetical protein